jgi:hypothetical protein
MFWRVWRRLFIDEVVDEVLFFNLLMNIVGYYFDPTTREEELRYCRQVLLFRPHAAAGSGRPPWRHAPPHA